MNIGVEPIPLQHPLLTPFKEGRDVVCSRELIQQYFNKEQFLTILNSTL